MAAAQATVTQAGRRPAGADLRSPAGADLRDVDNGAQSPRPLAEPILDVGVIQRFGEENDDTLTLNPLPGDRLKITFTVGDHTQTITADEATVEITRQPLPEPIVDEHIVLSSHRSFESAEDSARYWSDQGIEVELAQPEKWQVWAKRDVYRTPLLRRLLLHNIQAKGAKTAFLDSTIHRDLPQTTYIIGGYRYSRDQAEIETQKNRLQVDQLNDDVESRLYGGDVTLQPNAYGTYTVVNHVPIETYLRGVVPHEIGLSAPPTTIEAQAVLARTYALRNLRRFEIDNYQLCADTQCQVYWGLNGASDISDRAIQATQGQVLTYNNQLIDALYSSTTGGVTAPFSDVWNGEDRPYLKAVVDSVNGLWDISRYSLSDEGNFRRFMAMTEGFNEDGWDRFRWRREEKLPQIAADMRTYLRVIQHPLANFSQLIELKITERADSGRIQSLDVVTDQGTIELKKDEILRALYPPISTLFYLEPLYEERPAAIPDAPPDAAPNPSVESSPSAEPAAKTSSAGLKSAEPAPKAILLTTEAEGAEAEAIKVDPNAVIPSSSDPANPEPVMETVLSGYAFVGGGFGHGVGMSQTGAYNLGALGWSRDRILEFYYPGSTLQPLHEELVFWRSPDEAE
ncbi:MAG: SpoIID/LytB domain-containing protein [Elainellaceae cyanobacterium]